MSITTALESVWPHRVEGAKGGVVCDFFFWSGGMMMTGSWGDRGMTDAGKLRDPWRQGTRPGGAA